MGPHAKLAVALIPAALYACSFDWNAFDPRLSGPTGSGGAVGAGGSGNGGSGGGGAATTGGTGGVSQGGGGGMAPLGPWSAPKIVAALSDPADDDDPTMTADGLELFFNSRRAGTGGDDIWVSTRASTSDPWDPPSEVVELNSTNDEGNHTVSPDGLTMYLPSRRTSVWQMYTSTRPNRTSSWSTPALATELNAYGISEVSGVTEDGLLMLASIEEGTGLPTDMAFLVRSSTSAPWGTPTPIAELNVADAEDNEGWLHPLGTSVVFASYRMGGAGSADLYFSERTSTAEPFSPPMNISELNGIEYDSDPTLSPDLRYIVFASRPMATGGREIYDATR